MRKKTFVAVLILLCQFGPAQEAQALENEQFWLCAVAQGGFDISALYAHTSCRVAITAPNPVTLANCFISIGGTVVTGGAAYLACRDLIEGVEDGDSEREKTAFSGSPILLDLNRDQFHLSSGPVLFDIDGDSSAELITWVAPNADDAFLYLDLNGNLVVDNGHELFGDSTLLRNLARADHGYQALAEFDMKENGGFTDGVIDELDSVYKELRVWIDRNADGVSDIDETMTLTEAGVVAISLDYRESPRIDAFGNEFRYIGRGEIVKNGRPKKLWTTDVFFKVLAN